MNQRRFLLVALVPALLLLVPLVAMQFTDEVNWSPGDFLVAWVLLAGAGLAYQLVTGQSNNGTYRVAVGVAVATALALVWVNLAVGLIGDGNHSGNLLYGAVLLIGVGGALLARLQARGMARALFATALAQLLVPAAILFSGDSAITGREWVGNTGFALLFALSGWLFRRATCPPRAETSA